MTPTQFRDSAVPADVRPGVERVDGQWLLDDGTEAIGVHAQPLSAVLRPDTIRDGAGEIKDVLVTLSQIRKYKLLWAMDVDATTSIEGVFDETTFRMSYAWWLEHADQPVDTTLAEHDGNGIERSAAAIERRYRAARRALDQLALERAVLLQLATLIGRSRRALAQSTSLSAVRIQQIVDSPTPDAESALNTFLGATRPALLALRQGPVPAADLQAQLGADHADELLADLVALQLIDVADDAVELTPDGRKLLAAVTDEASVAGAR
ncbi:MAG: hypothetical protein PGN13_08520 [Patulibacter minatonensis]